jgi:hypothetical protein
MLMDMRQDRRIHALFLANQSTGHAQVMIATAPGVFQTFTIQQIKTHSACVCSNP